MSDIFNKPNKTKIGRAMELLKMLPNPLYPQENEVVNEVQKICEAVPCHRGTVYDARNELKLRHLLLQTSMNVGLSKFEKLKAVTMRSVSNEWKSHTIFLYEYLQELFQNEDIMEIVIEMNILPDNQDRLRVIEGYIGVKQEEE